jgi:hypothetical protein
MNTVGNRNRGLDEKPPTIQRAAVALLRATLPPQRDNEDAAEYLRTGISDDDRYVEWVAVRPDSLLDESNVTDYVVHPSPTRNVITNAGKTSRINVAEFMAELITDDDLWNDWRGQMPAVYNKGFD